MGASGSYTKRHRWHWSYSRRAVSARALVAEAPGARASTGRARILDVVATDYHQRTPLYIGSAEEVTWAERSHQEVPE